MNASFGSIVVCKPKPIGIAHGKPVGILFMSDIHIGSSMVDLSEVKKDLKMAAENNDRININGDILDLILISDTNRYLPGSVSKRYRHRTDLINAAIDEAVDLFKPYAANIDMMGIGNHENYVVVKNGVDPLSVIVHKLNEHLKKEGKDHEIIYGGYCGFLDYRFHKINGMDERSGRRSHRWVVFYHHGVSSGTGVNRGVGDFQRLAGFVDADAIWLGHNHQKSVLFSNKISCSCNGETVKNKSLVFIRTGSYLYPYTGTNSNEISANGYNLNYVAKKMMLPGGNGSVRLVFDLSGDSDISIKVEI